jgi:integrase
MGKRGRKRTWSHRVGERGYSVCVYERVPGGPIYARTADGNGRYIRLSLGHSDREQAQAYALGQAAKLREGLGDIRAGRLAIARLFALYGAHHTPNKSLGEQGEDNRRFRLWLGFLGSKKLAERNTRQEWQTFAHVRASGALDAQGNMVGPDHRKPVRPRCVQRDLLWLRSVLNWATTWQTEDGRFLLGANPVRGFETPTEENPRRPVASTDRLEAVLKAAETLEMELRWGGKARRQRAYLADILTLAAKTGRRITAILSLKWQDVLWDQGPHGSIRWQAAADKQGREWVAPLSPESRAVLDRMKGERPGVGAALLFPSPTNPDSPVTYERVRTWLLRAEESANVSKQEGGSFHPYRRAWATARKHLPLVDVAAAGGWKSTAVLLRHYQQPDGETLLRVVLGGGELRERHA